MKSILEAIRFADKLHQGQKRKVSGDDYFTHPLMVSYLIPQYKKSKNMEMLVVAAILHDVVEDTDISLDIIQETFGKDVATIVNELTSDKEKIKQMGKNEYLKEKLKTISSYSLVIKLIDRLSNLHDNPKDSYVSDTQDLIASLIKSRKLTPTHKAIIFDIECQCRMLEWSRTLKGR